MPPEGRRLVICAGYPYLKLTRQKDIQAARVPTDHACFPAPMTRSLSSEVLAPGLAQLSSDANSPAISGKHGLLQPGSWDHGGGGGHISHPSGPETAGDKAVLEDLSPPLWQIFGILMGVLATPSRGLVLRLDWWF